MRVTVLLASQRRFAAAEPVLAELDEARRALLPSGVELSAVLLGGVDDLHRERLLTHASQLGIEVSIPQVAEDDFASALLGGFRVALATTTDLVVSLDADGQHDPRQIPTLVRSHIARGSGLTIGSRWARGGASPGTSAFRSGLSRLGNSAVKVVTGARGVSDSTTSFRVYSPDVLRLLLDEQLPTETYGYFSAMVAVVQAHGFAVDEVPITFRPRYADVGTADGKAIGGFAASLVPVRRHVREIRRQMRSNQALWAQRNPRLRAQANDGESVFGAMEELSNLADADRFLNWICDEMEPHLGRRVVEVGAGVGAIASKLATQDRTVVAIEPATNVFPELCRRTGSNVAIDARQITSQQLLTSEGSGTFDSVVYVSVLEHIRDDTDELRTAFELLRPGGTLAIFVPAMPSLYGSLDFKSGHYRRYDKALLSSVVLGAGFDMIDLHFMDLVGVVPYFLMYRVLDVPTLDSGSSKVYDSMIVPVSRFIQNRVGPPALGKNLLAVARRPVD